MAKRVEPSKIWPLPIPHPERTSPLDFLPDLPDHFGRGKLAWEIMSMLRHTEGPYAGLTYGQHHAIWQPPLVKIIFGYEPFGERFFQEVMLLVARKNGKTSFIAALTLVHLLMEPEERGQMILLSDTTKTASLLFNSIVATIVRDKFLKRLFKIRAHDKSILHLETGTVISVAAAELSNLIGTNPSGYHIDELHLCGLRPRFSALQQALVTGTDARANYLGVSITTQAMTMPSGVFAAALARARRVQNGEAPEDSRFLPVLFEPPPGSQIEDKKYWWMANPSMGITFPEAKLGQAFRIAQSDPDPTKLAAFASQRLNIAGNDVGAVGVDRWIPSFAIEPYCDPALTDKRMMLQCSEFWVTIDRGGAFDLEAICVAGRTPEGSLIYWGQQFVTRAGFDKVAKYQPLEEFARAGELHVMDDPNDSLRVLAQAIALCKQNGTLRAVGYDMFQKGPIEQICQEAGAFGAVVPQGYKIHGALNFLERSLMEEKWRFCGECRMLRWNLDGAVVKWAGNARSIHKSISRHKVDGAVAWSMAGYLISEDVRSKVPEFDPQAMVG